MKAKGAGKKKASAKKKVKKKTSRKKKRMTGSLTKEFPLSQVEEAILLTVGGISQADLRANAAHKDIPAIIEKRFLLVEDNRILQDRFLDLVRDEGIGERLHKIMYMGFALRDHRIRRFVLERVARANGRWQVNAIRRKGNADFFEEFFKEEPARKARSNFEYFLVETGIIDGDNVNLSLDDGWLQDAVTIAAQHETNLNVRRQMTSDPIGYLVANNFNGIANCTVDELKALAGSNTTSFPDLEATQDDEIGDEPTQTKTRWRERKPTSSGRTTTTSEIDLVSRERAVASHYRLEKLLADLARAQRLDPLCNSNIDQFFIGTRSSLFEIKSCNALNMHAQVRKGISQLFEYNFSYRTMLGQNATKVLLLQSQPTGTKAWLVEYVQSLEIVIAWADEAFTCILTPSRIPPHLAGVLTAAT